MSLPLGEKQEARYTYDFARDGGAVGNISLSADLSVLKSGQALHDVYVKVETALASGGAATVTIGNSTDPDGYMLDLFALASADGNVVRASEAGGALLWDDTNDHQILHKVGSLSADQDLVIDVGTAALTAGKMSVYLVPSRL